MDGMKMNGQLGTKWFTFYTKVRPWFSCLAALTVFMDFLQYIDVYFNYWWMLLYFVMAIAQPVLAVIVFAKSSGDYEDFVRFVKRVLIFETINVAYQQGVQQYIKDFEIGSAFAIALIVFVILYFLWYRLNIKYFEKRILKEAREVVNYNFESRPPQISDPNEIPKTYGNYNVYGSDIRLYTEEKKEDSSNSHSVSPKVHFCRKCGNKLLEDSLFCNKCGTKIITEETQGK